MQFWCFWIHWVLVAAHGAFSSCGEQGLLFVGVNRLLIEVASLAAEHRLESIGSVATVPGLSCSMTCGIFPDQGWNPHPLHWQADSLPLDHQGSLIIHIVFNLFGKRKKDVEVIVENV